MTTSPAPDVRGEGGVVAYYLVEGWHFAIRRDGKKFSLWEAGVLTKRGIASVGAAKKQMRALIGASLDDRWCAARHALDSLQSARGQLHTGGAETFQVLEADHGK